MEEILKNIEDPSDFVFMEGAGKELTDKNKSTVVHEFVHRSLYENPELSKFYNENKLGYDERAHGMISYMVGQEFPELKKKEYERAKAIYDIDYFTKRTQKFKNSLTIKQSKNILTIPFEQFVLFPDKFINIILSSLETLKTSKTIKLLKKHKIPLRKFYQYYQYSKYSQTLY